MTEALMTIKPRQRVTWSAVEKAEWLSLFQASGQTAAEFCRENDFSRATLSLWLRKPQDPPLCEDDLIEVPEAALSSTVGTSAAVMLHLPHGVWLEIVPGTDPAWLAQLLRALAPAEA